MNEIDKQLEIWKGLKEKSEGKEIIFLFKWKSAGRKRKGSYNNKARKM